VLDIDISASLPFHTLNIAFSHYAINSHFHDISFLSFRYFSADIDTSSAGHFDIFDYFSFRFSPPLMIIDSFQILMSQLSAIETAMMSAFAIIDISIVSPYQITHIFARYIIFAEYFLRYY
jgi:hypothetical protein